MAVSFNLPKSPSKSVATIDNFLGVDFTNSPSNVDENKSPNAVNMIRDVPGKVRKRMGYEVIKAFDSSILTKVNVLPSFDATNTTDGNGNGKTTVQTNKEIRIDTLVPRYNHTTLTQTLLTKNREHKLEAGEYRLVIIDESNGNFVADNTKQHSVSLILFVYGSNTETKHTLKYPNADSSHSLKFTLTEASSIAALASFYCNDTYFLGTNFGFMIVEEKNYSDELEYSEYVETTTTLNVNGYHRFRGDEYPIIHVGSNYYRNNVVLFNDANDCISYSWQDDEYLYILDGKNYLMYSPTIGMVDVVTRATIPIVTEAKTIYGDAASFEPFNLLTRGFIETFISGIKEGDTEYNATFQLSIGDLASDTVTAWVLDANGDWNIRYEGTHFSVNRTTGVVRFGNAYIPGKPPLEGRPNVKIEAYRKEAKPDLIRKCRFGIEFGVNGAKDRLFFSGNPDEPNRDRYSWYNDYKFFPDNNYSILGSPKSAVVGYSIISNYLAAHKDENEREMSIIVREGDLVDNTATFKIINTLQGEGAIATNSFGYLSTEPIFLTRNGLYAVTAQDITGERYSQSRSFYLNGKLTKESITDLQNSFACVYDNMYFLAVGNDRVYVLDGLQSLRTDKSEPYSTRQYAGFYFEKLPIRLMWVDENRLYFGTSDGRICRFYNDKTAQNSYNDDGSVIECQWETPDIDGNLFYKNKTLRYVAARVEAAIRTSINIFTMERGLWNFVKTDNSFANYLSFDDIDFSRFSFSCDKTSKIARSKVRVKKVDKFRLRFTNSALNEPFTLYNIAMEYVENGNFKG